VALALGFAAVVATLLGGLFALRYQDKLHLILGFSAGAVLGVALFDLLPESHHRHPKVLTGLMNIAGAAVIWTAIHFAST